MLAVRFGFVPFGKAKVFAITVPTGKESVALGAAALPSYQVACWPGGTNTKRYFFA